MYVSYTAINLVKVIYLYRIENRVYHSKYYLIELLFQLCASICVYVCAPSHWLTMQFVFLIVDYNKNI